jgi:hypothetical protein
LFPKKKKYIKPSAQIRRYDAEDFFRLLYYYEQKLTLDNVVEILTQSALEEADETEPKHQLFEGSGLFEPGIRVLEDTDWNEQRAETTRQGIFLMIACYEVILKERKRYLSRQTSWIGFLK